MEGSCKLRLSERFMEKNTTTPGAVASILRSGQFKSSGSSDLLPAGERPENVYEYNSTLLTKQIAKANTRSCHVVSASFFHIDDACVKQSHYFDSMENQRTYFRFVQQGVPRHRRLRGGEHVCDSRSLCRPRLFQQHRVFDFISCFAKGAREADVQKNHDASRSVASAGWVLVGSIDRQSFCICFSFMSQWQIRF